MTKENIIRLHKHFLKLAEGKFSEMDFNKNYGKGGRLEVGEMTAIRKELIRSDALNSLKALEAKFPFLTGKEEKKEEVKKEDNILDKIAKNKKSKK